MDTRTRSIRILMFPWLAHGHISPFLQLAKSLAKRNIITYICSSQINLNSIKLSEKESISIKLVELQIPSTPQLPPHYHTTNGLPPHLMTPLKRALDAVRPDFATLLKTLKPDLLLYDFLQPWAPEEAYSMNIPAVLFFTTGAAACSFLMHHWLDSDSEYPFPAIHYRENEHDKDLRFGTNEDQERVRNCVKRSSDIVLIKTFRDLEGEHVDYLSTLTHKKFVPVGPLIQKISSTHNDNKIIEWLSGKEPRSTIFASFGSEYFLTEHEIHEIALGLEQSNLNFIWVIRFPHNMKANLDQVLPKGFLTKIGGRGLVVEGWAPQGRILSHESVGGFLSHCGWSSVMEGVYFGVAIVAVPMHLDQPLNARLVEEVGIGKEVVRDKGGELEGGEVGRVVREVVGCEVVRRRVEEVREGMMREKGEVEIDGVVEEVVKLCVKRERETLLTANSMEKFEFVMRSRERAC